jgi:hypothetical protein
MQRPLLTATQERFLAYHRAANHSPKLLSHYETCAGQKAHQLEDSRQPSIAGSRRASPRRWDCHRHGGRADGRFSQDNG